VALPNARGAERAHVEFGEHRVQGFAHIALNHALYLRASLSLSKKS
jgi:hypothetical protein